MFRFVTGKIERRLANNRFDCLLEIVYHDEDVLVLKVGWHGESETIALMRDDQTEEDYRLLQYHVGMLAQAKAREVAALKEFGNSLFERM